MKTKLKLWDFLDPQNGLKVDEKFYLSKERLEMISKWKAYEKPLEKIMDKQSAYTPTLTTRSFDMTSSIKLVIENIFPSNHHGGKIYSPDNISTTFKHNNNNALHINENNRIRKLTPSEAFRLMGLK